MPNPAWIVVDNGQTFEGHQLNWADCFFSNATLSAIKKYIEDQSWDFVIREMTDQEVAEHPESIEFEKFLLATYGEI